MSALNYTRKDFLTAMTKFLDPEHSIQVVPPLTAPPGGWLCYHCVTARKQDSARVVNEAITLAPVSINISDAVGNVIGIAMVALPHCMPCLGGTGSRLLTS